MQPPRLVAIDSNVLLALAEEEDEALDAWEIIRLRLRPVMLFVPPTVLEEMGHKASDSSSAKIQHLARKALREFRSRWQLQAVELRSDQEAIVETAAWKLRETALLPLAERNDAYILAEAAVLECTLLVSADSHLRDIGRSELKQALKAFDLDPPVIATPREIIKKFYH